MNPADRLAGCCVLAVPSITWQCRRGDPRKCRVVTHDAKELEAALVEIASGTIEQEIGKSMNTKQSKRKASDPSLNNLASALHAAEQAANESMLPQTVFMDSQSHGWWHTWNGARRIENATRLHVTVLPARYFC